MIGIQRRKTHFGLVLTIQPFGTKSKFHEMKIEAEVVRPSTGKGDVSGKFSFSRMPIAEKFSPVEMMTWVEACRAILEPTRAELEKARSVVTAIAKKRVRQTPKKRKATAAK